MHHVPRPQDEALVIAGMLTDASLRDQRSIAEASVLPSSMSDPRLEPGADANTTRAAVTNFKGAHHVARRQARHYKALPGSISDECMARLTTLVRFDHRLTGSATSPYSVDLSGSQTSAGLPCRGLLDSCHK